MERDRRRLRLNTMDLHFVLVDADTADSPTGAEPHPVIAYGFGDGHGATSEWSSIADRDLSGDGVRDAVGLDFDGDGRPDDAMWDSDGDGRADLAALDTDDDGAPDAYYSDTGRGLWDHRVTDVASARPAPPTGADSTAPGATAPGRVADLDADGASDDRVIDTDGSGRAEIGLVFAGASDSSPTRLLIDLDGDGVFDAALIDDDSDGAADLWSTRGQVRFDEGSARD